MLKTEISDQCGFKPYHMVSLFLLKPFNESQCSPHTNLGRAKRYINLDCKWSGNRSRWEKNLSHPLEKSTQPQSIFFSITVNYTRKNEKLEPKNHPIEKEHNLPNLHFWVKNVSVPRCSCKKKSSSFRTKSDLKVQRQVWLTCFAFQNPFKEC